jgi:acetyl-CoA carboxylase carboxyl transferase subunit beta
VAGPVVAASALVRDDAGRVLLVRRGRGDNVGLWSLPGGKREPGEAVADTAVRELAEETGLAGQAGAEVAVRNVAVPGAPGYRIHVVTVAVPAGCEAVAGDDAAAVGWFDEAQRAELPLTEGLQDLLAEN